MPVEIMEQAAEAGVTLAFSPTGTIEMNIPQADYDNSVLLEDEHANV